MELTVGKAEIINNLIDLINSKDDKFFSKVRCGDKTLYIAYSPMSGFRSLIIGNHNKMYAFIKESLTEEDRKKELDILFEDRELHHFNLDEINKMNKLIEQQSTQLSYKSINYDDVNRVIESSTLGEYKEIIEFTQQLNKILDCKHDGTWNNSSKLLYMFKLGVMQGKREERSRRKKVAGGNV